MERLYAVLVDGKFVTKNGSVKMYKSRKNAIKHNTWQVKHSIAKVEIVEYNIKDIETITKEDLK